MTTTTILDQLQRDEGFSSHPYTDSVGKLTIGYGFNISPTGPGLSEEESSAVLAMRITKVDTALIAALPWVASLDAPRHAALLNMAYNMGLGVPGGQHGLLSFGQFLSLVQSGRYDDAADDELHTLWAKQVGARAQRIALQIRTGTWQ
jgi:lysozyme